MNMHEALLVSNGPLVNDRHLRLVVYNQTAESINKQTKPIILFARAIHSTVVRNVTLIHCEIEHWFFCVAKRPLANENQTSDLNGLIKFSSETLAR